MTFNWDIFSHNHFYNQPFNTSYKVVWLGSIQARGTQSHPNIFLILVPSTISPHGSFGVCEGYILNLYWKCHHSHTDFSRWRLSRRMRGRVVVALRIISRFILGIWLSSSTKKSEVSNHKIKNEKAIQSSSYEDTPHKPQNLIKSCGQRKYIYILPLLLWTSKNLRFVAQQQQCSFNITSSPKKVSTLKIM